MRSVEHSSAALIARSRRSTTALVIVATIVVTVGMTAVPSVQAQMYACGTPCYGTQAWSGGQIGAFTSISILPIYDNQIGCGDFCFINNEEWLSNQGCYCWIEAGYKSKSSQLYFFWAQNSGTCGNCFSEHFLADVPSADLYQRANILLHVYLQFFQVTMYGTDSSGNFWDYGGGFQPPTPSSDYIQIGQELHGNYSASAPQAAWDSNSWYTSDGNPHYQTSVDPNLQMVNSPISAYWNPDPQDSATGGTWFASCC